MTLEQRMERLEAQQAIADLIHGYARLIRHNEPEHVGALFLPDAVFEIRDGHPSRAAHTVRSRLEGRGAISDHVMPMKGQPHPVPLIHNLMTEIDGDEATANSVMEAQVIGSSHKVQGEYRDVLRRVDGRWYFAARTYTIFAAASSV